MTKTKKFKHKALKFKTLTIDRRKWGRGHTGGALLNPSLKQCKARWADIDHTPSDAQVEHAKAKDGKMCCLGFVCLKAGVPKKFILNQGLPGDMASQYASKMGFLTKPSGEARLAFASSEVAFELAGINDYTYTTDAQKEKAITKIFAKHGIKVKFTH